MRHLLKVISQFQHLGFYLKTWWCTSFLNSPSEVSKDLSLQINKTLIKMRYLNNKLFQEVNSLISEIEFENLFQKMLLNNVEGISAYKEYCLKRWQAGRDQANQDNRFLNYLSTQSTLAQCSLEVLCLAASIYCQDDGYAKPANFVKLLEEAASLPLPAAHCAYLNLSSKFTQENTLKNIKDQSQILAAQHNSMAQYNLGLIYQIVVGLTAEEMRQKEAIAVEWFRKAAAQGNVAAQCSLGVMFSEGYGISPEEMAQKDAITFEWYRQAAAQGHAGAQHCLGCLYEAGRGIPAKEIPQKDRLAVEWFRRAALQGHAEAQYDLGRMYEAGRGILEHEKPDKAVLAYFWRSKSASSFVFLKEILKNHKTITPYQLQKATMMLTRGLDYPQVTYLFQKGVFQSFLLLALVIKNKNSPSVNPGPLQRLPSDLLFKIAQQFAPISAEEIRDIYRKLIPTLSKELDFKAKAKDLAANNPRLFFKSESVAASVESGAPLPLQEVEQYAKENPESLEAHVYNQLKN